MVDARVMEEAVAIFGCAVSQSSHTEFWGFSTAKPDLYPKSARKLKANLSKK